jgi:RHS repeat-associated protein
MKSRFNLFLLLVLLFLVVPDWIFAAQAPVFEIDICPDETKSVYTNAQYRANKSDGICNSGTQLRHHLSGDTEIVKSIVLERLEIDDTGHRAKVEIDWEPGKTGTAVIEVEFRYRYHDAWGDCDWSGWKTLYTYKINRLGLSPGGSLEGPSIFTTDGKQSVDVDLTYTKGSSYSFDVNQMRVWINGQSRNDGVGTGTGSSIPLNYSFDGSALGDYEITTQVKNNCDQWMAGPSKTISIRPSCWDDSELDARLTLSGGEVTEYDTGTKVEPGITYTIIPEGITDFSSHYDLKHDGEEDITLSGNSFTVHAKLGSYRIDAVRKGGRGLCSVVPPLVVFVGGHDVTIEQECLITLPGALIDFGYEVEPDEPALQHFAATIRSQRGILVRPGITLSMGAELILDYEEPQIDSLELNPDMNFIQTTTYDEYGRVAGQSRQYFDEQGRVLQSQYKILDKDVTMATQTIYDAYGRPVINTLPAPVASGTLVKEDTECGDQVERGAKVRFAYKADFVSVAENEPYNYTHFDLEKEENPDPVWIGEEGTLGWYYSANNGTSLDEKLNERQVAVTDYPYSRVLYHHDGSGEAKNITSPGNAFRAGGGHLSTADTEAVTDEDSYLENYFDIRSDELGLSSPATYAGNFFKSVVIDPDGRKSVSYQDKAGTGIISLYFGTQSTPISRSYQFFNSRGQLIVSLTPNGWSQYNGGNFDLVDKTDYSYDAKGRLVEMDETDAGITKYVYRKDGSIRFSQNAEQEKDGRFSYTNYDRSGRPFESGEYVPGAGGIRFQSPEMEDKLENTTTDGGLADGTGTKQDRILTFYDEADPEFANLELPVERVQRFVQGAVSYTRKENTVTTWYSYDEQGRVEWLVQDIEGLGVKTVDYRYGPTGAVQEVAYQKGVEEEDFYHFYTYNADGQLLSANTSTEELLYNQFGEITNPEALKEQVAYQYYLHGPLKRVELAGNLQGIDYIYTANGALKSINHADKDLDPSQDGTANSFREDVFGMTLDYYADDYQGAGYNAGSLSLSGIPEQYTGNIQAQSWHSPVDGGERRTYAYTYDERFQLAEARWGNHAGGEGSYSFVGSGNNAYQERIPGYDLNGNIERLQRKGEMGENLADFTYHYTGNTNQLEEVQHNGESFRKYAYNEIGQMRSQLAGEEAMHLQYDVSGKVTGVYKNYNSNTGEYFDPIVLFTYDDRGFRLAKTSFDEDGNELLTSWYVRDASGSILSVYTEDPAAATIAQAELPIYGAGKIGIYRPNALMNKHMYELADHLGNVRAVIGETIEVEYLATMESERFDTEERYFEGLQTVPTSDFINHTQAEVTVNGTAFAIENPNEVIRINNALDNPRKVIGGAIRLPVAAGDTIRTEVFAKYADFERNSTNILPGLATYLGTAFGVPGGGDGAASLFAEAFEPGSLASVALGNASEDHPRAFLNYILFDKNFTVQDFGLVQVSEDAEIQTLERVDGEELVINNPHERLSLEVPINKSGFIYIYVSNDDGQNMDVYFDDFKVTHTYGDIVAGSDYYPYGLAMEGREIDREGYRFGYQGQFAERDKRIGLHNFEARMYNAKIGRWNNLDPAGQFHSPYLAMANNPTLYVDKDGKIVWNAVGAAAGAIVGAGFSIGSQMLLEDKPFSEVQWGRVGAAAITGGIAGSGIGLISASVTLGAGELVDQGLAGTELSFTNAAIAAGSAYAGGKAGLLVHKGLQKLGVVAMISGKVASSSGVKTIGRAGQTIRMYSSTKNVRLAQNILSEGTFAVTGSGISTFAKAGMDIYWKSYLQEHPEGLLDHILNNIYRNYNSESQGSSVTVEIWNTKYQYLD